ncbi:hypothetical protein H2200_010197 [Cladophialophora chaetospira]|uniref:Uncharacterized protein n=1 Tax=Cladophialophora chaetospira TaxID=386627 RepID=A0AA39CEI8_9EURO|nr:hypothetical protein H2200_010197 [Cladophialophora chaetospira]
MEPSSSAAKRKRQAIIPPPLTLGSQEPSVSAMQLAAYQGLYSPNFEYSPETPSKRRAFGYIPGLASQSSSPSTTLTPLVDQYMKEDIADLSRKMSKALEELDTEDMETDGMDTEATLDDAGDNVDAAHFTAVAYQEMRPEERFAQNLASAYGVYTANSGFAPIFNPSESYRVQYENHNRYNPGIGLLQNVTGGLVGQAPVTLSDPQPFNRPVPTLVEYQSNVDEGVSNQLAHNQDLYTMGAESLRPQLAPNVASDATPSMSNASTDSQDEDKWQYEAGVAMTLMSEKDADPVWENRKILNGYPDPTNPAQNPPAGITGEDFCRYYPNHLDHHYLSHFIKKRYSGIMMAEWVDESVKGAWKQFNICKDPGNMLGKRLVTHRNHLGPDGMKLLDVTPSFLKDVPIDGEFKFQKETTGEKQGRDPATWLANRVKDREDREVKNKKAKLKREQAKAKNAQATNSN